MELLGKLNYLKIPIYNLNPKHSNLNLNLNLYPIFNLNINLCPIFLIKFSFNFLLFAILSIGTFKLIKFPHLTHITLIIYYKLKLYAFEEKTTLHLID